MRGNTKSVVAVAAVMGMLVALPGDASAQARMSRTDMIAELESSFAFFSSNVRSMTDQVRMAEGAYFGTAMPNHAVIASALSDMHEHLGQLIAYARTNAVVPPWSS